MLKGRVSALEQARRDNYDIDLENDVVMRAAPPLPLVQAPLVHYAAELAKYMVDERYESFLTELASQNMQQQMRLDAQQQQFREQQQQLALTASPLSPFETAVAKALCSRGQTAVAEALCSRGQTPAAVTGLGKGRARRKVSKERRSGASSCRVSPQPATPTTNPLVAALPVVEPRTPLIVVEDERPFDVAASTPLPHLTTQGPLLRQQCAGLRQNPWVMLDRADFRGQQRSRLRLIVLLVVGSREKEVNSLGLIGYLVNKVRVNLLYYPQVLSHDLQR